MVSELVLRLPTAEDGVSVFNLIQSCPPLDTNSVYCNLLQCSYFAETSVAAEQDGELVGFVSGYLVPSQSDRLFVWQVAVAEKARGQGLAGKMLKHILSRDFCKNITFIETTITESNSASWALFEGFSKRLNTNIKRSTLFDKECHFRGKHDTETLVSIGPF